MLIKQPAAADRPGVTFVSNYTFVHAWMENSDLSHPTNNKSAVMTHGCMCRWTVQYHLTFTYLQI